MHAGAACCEFRNCAEVHVIEKKLLSEQLAQRLALRTTLQAREESIGLHQSDSLPWKWCLEQGTGLVMYLAPIILQAPSRDLQGLPVLIRRESYVSQGQDPC